MVSEVSILIPVYNQNVLTLVETLRQEASSLSIPFEIRVYDDGSNPETLQQNRSLKGVSGVVYQEMTQNFGRSLIRYKLAQEARFSTLLFLDNDVQPVHPDFLQKYLAAGSEGVAVGGVAYKESPPHGQELRWKYGKFREQASARDRQNNPYQRVFSSNLFLPKEVFLACFPNNELSGYGHEDTLFAWRLQQKNIPVHHIDNPVWHLGLEPAEVFLLNSQQAIHNLVLLHQKYGLGEETKLMKAHGSLTKWKVGQLLRENRNWLFPLLKKNLVSRKPNLRMFDLYRLLLLDKYLKK